MAKRILIAEDVELSRKMLKEILEAEYSVLEARDGEAAIRLLRSHSRSISAVATDLVMPQMDGYTLLERIRANGDWAEIPVVVATASADEEAELRALSLGANEFITKPYKPALILNSLRNAIKLRESAAITNTLRRDTLTGLYNREGFFWRAKQLLENSKPGDFIMTSLDIENFKVVNDQYGTGRGDEVLKTVAGVLREAIETWGGICSRISADNFAVLFPRGFFDSDDLFRMRTQLMHPVESMPRMTFSVGNYVIDDLSVPLSAMYDRAVLAKQSVKGRYDVHVALYDDAMRDRLLHEQQIVTEMHGALESSQFEAWFQPQYNHATGALIGAEALVRWRHPQKGLILPPGTFIPVFERNGFIYELDKFVWEQSCILLRKWIDAGEDPLPISVNISRHDVFREDFLETVTGLIETYRIPVSLLRLEITESAFAESTEQIVRIVKELIALGFEVEIDDFSSGYSSLNTLKDVPATILKLDMKFLESSDDSQRGGNILQSIVRMSKWLGMSVIAEGVETREQADYLKSIGCCYVQGYYYAKPMPMHEYEALALRSVRGERLLSLETVENLDNNAFWDPRSMDTLIFNSYVGGACIFEYQHGEIEMLRVNSKYAETLSGGGMSSDEAMRIQWKDHLDREDAALLDDAIRRAIGNRDEASAELRVLDLPNAPKVTYLRLWLRIIASAGERYLVYTTHENITAQREAEIKERALASRMSAIMAGASSGITAVSVRGETPRILFANDRYYAMLGYTREQFEAEVATPQELVHPEDMARMRGDVHAVIETKQPSAFEYRCRTRSGEWIHVRCSASIASLEDEGGEIMISIVSDISELVLAQQEIERTTGRLKAIMGNISGGVTAIAFRPDGPHLLFANDQFYRQIGYTREQFEAELSDPLGGTLSEDRARVRQEAERAGAAGRPFSLTYRSVCRDGSVRWMKSNVSVTTFPGETAPVQLAVATDITDERENALMMDELLNAIPGGVVIYRVGETIDTLYSSDGVAKLTGVTEEEYDTWLHGDLIASAVYADDAAAVRTQIASAVADDRPLSLTFRLRHKDGGTVWVEFSATKIREDQQGKIYYGIFTKPATEAALYRSLVEDSTTAAIIMEKRGRKILYANPAWRRIENVPEDAALTGVRLFDLIPGENRYLSDEDIQTLPYDHYQRMDRISTLGRRLTVHARSLIWNGVDAYVCYMNDDTELWNSHRQLQQLIDRVPVGLGICEIRAGRLSLTYINDAYYRMLGYRREQRENYLGTKLFSAIYPDDRPAILERMQRIMAGEPSIEAVYRTENEKGDLFWIRIQSVVIERDEELITVYCAFTDLNTLMHSQQEAESSRAMLDTALQSAKVMGWRYDYRTRTITDTGSIGQLYRLPKTIDRLPDSIIESGYICKDSEETLRELFREAAREKPVTRDVCVRIRKDGPTGWMRLIYTPVFDRHGSYLESIGTSIDITEQKEREHKYAEQLKVKKVLAQNELAVVLLNLTGNTVVDVECANPGMQHYLDKGSVDDLIAAVGSRITDAREKSAFLTAFDRAALLVGYREGTLHGSVRYKSCEAGRWLESSYDLMKNPHTGDVESLTILRDVSAVVRTEQIAAALMRIDYESIVTIDAETGAATPFVCGHVASVVDEQKRVGNNVAGVEAYLRQRCADPDVERVIRETSLPFVKERLAEAPEHTVFYSIRHDGRIVRRRTVYAYLNESRDSILCAMQNLP